jgi:tRNA(fMet)-specific endonuclease VapC
MDYLSDATFLIDLWREGRNKGPAREFADEHPEAVVAVPWIAKAEFLRGAFVAGQGPAAETFLRQFQTVWPNEGTLRIYADLFGELRAANTMIGPHDLWVAAAARELKLPLLTRNADEFKRVADLQVVAYGIDARC